MKTHIWTISSFTSTSFSLSHIFFSSFLDFSLLNHFENIRCIVKLLIATFVEIQLKKENLKNIFWVPDIPASQMACIHHWSYPWARIGSCKNFRSQHPLMAELQPFKDFTKFSQN